MQIVQTPLVHFIVIAILDFMDRDILALVSFFPLFLFLFFFPSFSSISTDLLFVCLLLLKWIIGCSCGSGSSGPSCSSSGVCTCSTGWTGSKCDQCLSSYFGSTCQGSREIIEIIVFFWFNENENENCQKETVDSFFFPLSLFPFSPFFFFFFFFFLWVKIE